MTMQSIVKCTYFVMPRLIQSLVLTHCVFFLFPCSDRKEKIAYLKCRICQQSFELSPINYLHQPIDIFCAWVDELEEANKRGSDDDEEDDEDLFSDDENDKWEKQNARQ
jgi:transcription elongation factor Elf1